MFPCACRRLSFPRFSLVTFFRFARLYSFSFVSTFGLPVSGRDPRADPRVEARVVQSTLRGHGTNPVPPFV